MHAPSPRRLFHGGPLAAGGSVRLDAQASHHALRVLRLAAGDTLELFNGDGMRYPACLLDADARGASASVGEPVATATESPLPVGLAQAVPAGDKMDWVVEKAVELGAVAIQPLYSRRSLLRLDGAREAKRLEHWRRIAVAACMQCGRDRLPAIGTPMELGRWLSGDAAGDAAYPPPGALRLVRSPRGAGTLAAVVPPLPAAWLLAGPEAGLAPEEESAALAAGWRSMRLGPRTLRAETAGLAAIAALQARLGDLA
jgi:16S rRNA (uracil1498-N3)-methyltransferase